MDIPTELKSYIFSYLTDEIIYSYNVCKEWKQIINNSHDEITISYDVVDSIYKLLYFCIYPSCYTIYCDIDYIENEINGELLTDIILHNLSKGNYDLLLFFDHNRMKKYEEDLSHNTHKKNEVTYSWENNYILNYPKIINYLLEIDHDELLEWMCKEHSVYYPDYLYPQSLITITFNFYDDILDFRDIIESLVFECLYKYGYRNIDLPDDHYITKHMRHNAIENGICQFCFGTDPEC